MQQHGCLSSCLYIKSQPKQTHFKKTTNKQRIRLFLNSYTQPLRLKPSSNIQRSVPKNVHEKQPINPEKRSSSAFKHYEASTDTKLQRKRTSDHQFRKMSIDILKPTPKPKELNTPSRTNNKQYHFTIETLKPTVSTIKWKQNPKSMSGETLKIIQTDALNIEKDEVSREKDTRAFSKNLFHCLLDTPSQNMQTNASIKPSPLEELMERSEIEDSQVSRCRNHKCMSQSGMDPQMTPKIMIYDELVGDFLVSNAHTISSHDSNVVREKQENILQLSQVIARYRRSDLMKNNDTSDELRRRINFSTTEQSKGLTFPKLSSISSINDSQKYNQF